MYLLLKVNFQSHEIELSVAYQYIKVKEIFKELKLTVIISTALLYIL